MSRHLINIFPFFPCLIPAKLKLLASILLLSCLSASLAVRLPVGVTITTGTLFFRFDAKVTMSVEGSLLVFMTVVFSGTREDGIYSERSLRQLH